MRHSTGAPSGDRDADLQTAYHVIGLRLRGIEAGFGELAAKIALLGDAGRPSRHPGPLDGREPGDLAADVESLADQGCWLAGVVLATPALDQALAGDLRHAADRLSQAARSLAEGLDHHR